VMEVNRWMASVVIPILDAKDRCEAPARAGVLVRPAVQPSSARRWASWA
jgi:hypothetical protein